MQHTPGPWYADKIEDRNAYNVFPSGATHALVTVAAPAHDGAHPYGQAAEANARLIAAAPELLNVLREMAWHFRGYARDPRDPQGFGVSLIQEAHAAIARATE